MRLGSHEGTTDDSLEPEFTALAELREQGLIKHLGLSGVSDAQITEAQAIAPVTAIQNLYNLINRQDDALVARAAAEGIAFASFFPLGGFSPLQSDALTSVAERLGTSSQQVSLAWLLQRSTTSVVIPGTSSRGHLRENIAAADLVLPADAVAELDTIGVRSPRAVGDRMIWYSLSRCSRPAAAGDQLQHTDRSMTMTDAFPTAAGLGWASLASADPQTVASFYTAVLGWAITETDGRLIASAAGTPVADITPADEIPGWLIHFDVDNLDTALTAVSTAAGAVLPSVTGGFAETAVVTDRNGTRFALHAPATRHRERSGHGTLAWGELITDDVDTSAAFYREAFGWALTEPSGPLGRREWQSHGRSFSGLLPRPPAMPAETPAYWDVYFAVDDIEAAATVATKHGGTQLMPPTPIEIGTIAVFLDPAGAIFTLVQLTNEEAIA